MAYTMEYSENRGTWNIYDTDTGEWMLEGTYEQCEAFMDIATECELEVNMNEGYESDWYEVDEDYHEPDDGFPRHYWISAYSLITGAQFGVSLGATDDKDMMDTFSKLYPESEMADYGCYEDEV